MTTSSLFRRLVLASLVLALSSVVQAQETGKKTLRPEDLLVIPIGENGSIVLLTAVEYGAPDKLSFTSAYAHDIPALRSGDYVTSFRISVAPAVAGIRLKAGLGAYSHSGPGFHGDLVVMRTWGNPLKVAPDQTWVGAELRATALASLGVGYYQRVQGNRGRDSLFAVHFGVGF